MLSLSLLSSIFGCPVGYGVPGSGIRSSPSCDLCHWCSNVGSFNPLRWAGVRTCILVLQRCCQSLCATAGTPTSCYLLINRWDCLQGLRPQHGRRSRVKQGTKSPPWSPCTCCLLGTWPACFRQSYAIPLLSDHIGASRALLPATCRCLHDVSGEPYWW